MLSALGWLMIESTGLEGGAGLYKHTHTHTHTPRFTTRSAGLRERIIRMAGDGLENWHAQTKGRRAGNVAASRHNLHLEVFARRSTRCFGVILQRPFHEYHVPAFLGGWLLRLYSIILIIYASMGRTDGRTDGRGPGDGPMWSFAASYNTCYTFAA
ncbi:hypothetical protein F4779DRAFT_329140 [Xylariaceae sp. FL0662B]|nr:hypothetical protein F4779DRAFT_329140 [Xylariaceae sp. FL0662B]